MMGDPASSKVQRTMTPVIHFVLGQTVSIHLKPNSGPKEPCDATNYGVAITSFVDQEGYGIIYRKTIGIECQDDGTLFLKIKTVGLGKQMHPLGGLHGTITNNKTKTAWGFDIDICVD
jgi:hypothetical protein